MRLRDVKSGFAICEYANWNKYSKNAFAIRFINDKEDAIYNANSMSRCDGITYCVYDSANGRIVH